MCFFLYVFLILSTTTHLFHSCFGRVIDTSLLNLLRRNENDDDYKRWKKGVNSFSLVDDSQPQPFGGSLRNNDDGDYIQWKKNVYPDIYYPSPMKNLFLDYLRNGDGGVAGDYIRWKKGLYDDESLNMRVNDWIRWKKGLRRPSLDDLLSERNNDWIKWKKGLDDDNSGVSVRDVLMNMRNNDWIKWKKGFNNENSNDILGTRGNDWIRWKKGLNEENSNSDYLGARNNDWIKWKKGFNNKNSNDVFGTRGNDWIRWKKGLHNENSNDDSLSARNNDWIKWKKGFNGDSILDNESFLSARGNDWIRWKKGFNDESMHGLRSGNDDYLQWKKGSRSSLVEEPGSIGDSEIEDMIMKNVLDPFGYVPSSRSSPAASEDSTDALDSLNVTQDDNSEEATDVVAALPAIIENEAIQEAVEQAVHARSGQIANGWNFKSREEEDSLSPSDVESVVDIIKNEIAEEQERKRKSLLLDALLARKRSNSIEKVLDKLTAISEHEDDLSDVDDVTFSNYLLESHDVPTMSDDEVLVHLLKNVNVADLAREGLRSGKRRVKRSNYNQENLQNSNFNLLDSYMSSLPRSQSMNHFGTNNRWRGGPTLTPVERTFLNPRPLLSSFSTNRDGPPPPTVYLQTPTTDYSRATSDFEPSDDKVKIHDSRASEDPTSEVEASPSEDIDKELDLLLLEAIELDMNEHNKDNDDTTVIIDYDDFTDRERNDNIDKVLKLQEQDSLDLGTHNSEER